MAEYIKEYWEKQAQIHGGSHWASWGDNWAIDLEIDTIAQYIKDGDAVLDVGCANGYSAFRQMDKKKIKSMTGIDYAANMIEAANVVKAAIPDNKHLDFSVGDVRKIQFPDNSFDAVYTTRVLINLPTWDEQKQGIMECIRVAKPGGRIVLSEGFWEPLMLLNAMRSLKNLPPLVEHDFNRYLKISRTKEFLDEKKIKHEFEEFSSIYYLGSRFLRELVTDASQYEGYSNPVNKAFYEIEKEFSGGGFGIQQAVVITK